MPDSEATLVSIPASNYVEKARWALQLAGVAFREEAWAPPFIFLSTRPKGGRTVPLLALSAPNGAVFTDSSDILTYCAQKKPDLYPSEDTKRLELYYDTELGPHTRRCVYYIVFQDTATAHNVLAAPLGRIQYWITWLIFPVLTVMLKLYFDVNAVTAEKSWAKIERLAREAEKRLGDDPVGSRFLSGDSFSAADITFCAHISLLLLPREHAFLSPYFSVEEVQDSAFRERLERLRGSKAGQFVLWCYKHKRPPMLHGSKQL